MVNGFLHQSPQLPEMHLQQGGPMSHVHIDPTAGVHLRAKPASPQWANDFQSNQVAMEAAFDASPSTQFSAEEFARFGQINHAASSSSPVSQMPNGGIQHQRPLMGVGLMNMNMNMNMGYSMASGPMFQ